MRTTKELLQVMLENIDRLDMGLCKLSSVLYYDLKLIDEAEFEIIDSYLIGNLPERKETGFIPRIAIYSWPKGEKEPRIKWLKEQIEKLK